MKSGFVGALALGIIAASGAQAGTIEIYLAQSNVVQSNPNLVAWTLVKSGPSTGAVIFSGKFGDFSINSVVGQEIGGELDSNTINSGASKAAQGETLYVDVVETQVPVGATTDFLSSFTTNKLSKGWTVSEETLYGAIGGAVTLRASPTFTTPDTDIDATNGFATTTPRVIQEFYAVTLSSTAAIGSGKGDNSTIDLNYTAVPEPATWGMVGLGFAGLGLLRVTSRRKGPRYAI